MPARKHGYRRIAALCVAGFLLPALAACGPTADQVTARTKTAASTPSQPPVPQQAQLPTAEPEPATVPEPIQVTVSGAQAGMAEPVQDACQFLLRQEPGDFAGAADCVAEAMKAGAGAEQTVTTTASWLPPGTYTMAFRTAGEFSMDLKSADGELEISVAGGERMLRTADSKVRADSSGGAEESYAAVLADAAELTANPERLRGLVQSANPARVEYGVEYQGAPATRLTAVVVPEEPGAFSGTVTLLLDDLYRPLLVEYAGTNRGINTSIRAEITNWGAEGALG